MMGAVQRQHVGKPEAPVLLLQRRREPVDDRQQKPKNVIGGLAPVPAPPIALDRKSLAAERNDLIQCFTNQIADQHAALDHTRINLNRRALALMATHTAS